MLFRSQLWDGREEDVAGSGSSRTPGGLVSLCSDHDGPVGTQRQSDGVRVVAVASRGRKLTHSSVGSVRVDRVHEGVIRPASVRIPGECATGDPTDVQATVGSDRTVLRVVVPVGPEFIHPHLCPVSTDLGDGCIVIGAGRTRVADRPDRSVGKAERIESALRIQDDAVERVGARRAVKLQPLLISVLDRKSTRLNSSHT